jgi:nucleotide-binding universal stress UspA family protein
MNKRILLGVDATLSPATQYALHHVGEFIEQATPTLRLLLIHVIPIPYNTSPSLGMYVGQIQPGLVTAEQRTEAEIVLRKACLELQKHGIAREQIDTAIRVGIPADEIARIAKELQVDFIVVGSRGSSFWQKLRRFFLGSTSRKVLQLASCPVMIVVPPHSQTAFPSDLVTWYEEAITRYLREHSGDLAVFTPHEVAQMFAPPTKKAPGRKETAAAILALEHLARNGVLCRHDVKGEMRYVND